MSGISHERWQEIGALFHDVVGLDSSERVARLAEAGERDPSLRRAVEGLLEADAAAGERLARFEFGVSDLVGSPDVASALNQADPLGVVGATVSHFRVLDHLASGGMGVVYRAIDTQLERAVALKFPLPNDTPTAEVKERFLREARTIGALDHVNLCTVYEAGDSDHGLFLAMPLYPGETLKLLIARQGALSVEHALAIARQIAEGLSCAHAAGVVHRDLKPGNIMLLPDNTVKILDFGLAKVGDLSHTTSGLALGTVSYMSPEQIRGTSVDERADLWSLGVLLYEMLTGTRPFSGEREVSIVHAILHNDPKPPSDLRSDLPRGLQQIVSALLQKDPLGRYDSAEELADDIAAIRRGVSPSFLPPAPRRALVWLGKHRRAAALLAVIALTEGIILVAPGLSAALNKPTNNPAAFQLYTVGRDYERRGGPYAAAESLYRRALALDSGFALARARLAVVYAACQQGGSRDCARLPIQDRRGVDRLEQIRAQADTALQLQPALADAHFAMGLYWEKREDFARALAEYERARSGMRKSSELHAAIGRAYRAQGRWEEAIRELERALTLDPNDVTSAVDLATTFSRLRRYEESVKYWNRYLTLAPDAYQGMQIKGHVYLRWHGTVDTLAAIFEQLPSDVRKRAFTTAVLIARIRGRPADALKALDEAPRQPVEEPNAFQSAMLQRAQVYADMGDSVHARASYDAARVLLEKSAAQKPGDFRRQVALGLAYAGLGLDVQAKHAADSAIVLMPPSRTVMLGTTVMRGAAEILAQLPQYHGRAIELLDQLMQMPAGREASVPFLRVDPAWNTLRADPRFQQLLAKYARR